MSDGSDTSGRISSPLTTGGAGTSFEQHVDAVFLSLLLVRGFPPILPDCQVTEVSFQTEHLGWKTDDLHILTVASDGNDRKLIGQVKRTFTVSKANEECQKAILDFWTDFQEPGLFRRERDVFALFVLRGSNVMLGGLGEALEFARASRDAADFFARLAKPGMLNKGAIADVSEIRAIVTPDGKTISDDEFWQFLKSLHVVSYDLATTTRSTEAQMKSLLAFTANEDNPIAAAASTWNELVALVDRAMPYARTFRRNDLPPSVRNRHGAVADAGSRVLRQLADHSSPVLSGITTTIGGSVHLSRLDVKRHVARSIANFPITVVTGPSGSGKSAIASTVVRELATDHYSFAFRAEEFTAPHLDAVLHQAQVSCTATQLQAFLAAQSENVILVESVERLLEASVRHAFFDLLRTLPRDGSWRIVLTCRDYSLDIVRSSFLEQIGIPYEVILVPPLTEDELRDVLSAFPALTRAAEVPALRRLFRNPYFVDKAARMNWSETRPLPTDERAFRDKFWAEILRRDDQRDDALPRRREEAFRSLCLRRAQSLSVYARCDDLDREALDKLHEDGLIVYATTTDALAAPAHDVLEDWALIRWIGERAAIWENAPGTIANDLGTFPAVRRAYRKWLIESLECDTASADKYVLSVLKDPLLPNYFRDDTLTAVLGSSQSAGFLERTGELLLENDATLLRRVIHLLRIVCVAPPAWLRGLDIGHQLLVPDGPAWAAVLKATSKGADRLLPKYAPLLLGLIDDWVAIVAFWNPYPPGSDDAALIASALLPHYDSYRAEEQHKKALAVLAKIPKSAAPLVTDLLKRGIADDREDRSAEDFAEVVLSTLNGAAVARDFPDELIALADARLKYKQPDEQHWYRGFSRIEMEPVFGLDEHSDFHSSPASALQGPFLFLLQSHPNKTLPFIVKLMNHCCDAYAANTRNDDGIEPPVSIDVEFPDGTKTKQWANGRLWNLYRGTSVGPNILQSALMALEHSLLDVAKKSPNVLDDVLMFLLRSTNNVAVTAVVAGVVTAHPKLATNTAFVLLRNRTLVQMDRMRFANESQAPSSMLAAFAHLRTGNRVHDDDRKASDALEHRRRDLETVAPMLQCTEQGAQIGEIIDAHIKQLPPLDAQNDEDRIWRLALHRMDLRNYELDESNKIVTETAPAQDGAASPADGERRSVQIPLRLTEPEQDIQEMLNRSSDAEKDFLSSIELMNWGFATFERQPGRSDPTRWREMLQKSKSAVESWTPDAKGALPRLATGSPAFIAVVCVRDHWDEMEQQDRDWCIEQLEAALREDAETTNETLRASRSDMDAAVAAASVTPILLTKVSSASEVDRVKTMLAVAMTHAVSNVVRHAAAAVGREHAILNPTIFAGCIAAVVEQVQEERAIYDRASPWKNRELFESEVRKIAEKARQLIVGSRIYDGSPLAKLDMRNWREYWALYELIPLTIHRPHDPTTREFFLRLSETVAYWWGTARRRDRSDADRPAELENYCMEGIANFVLHLSPDQALAVCRPLIAQVDEEPKEAATFLSDLILAEDRFPHPETFWSVWSAFAEAALNAKWLSNRDREHDYGESLIHNLFLGHYWKDNVTHWATLDNQAHRVHDLICHLPATAVVFEGYARFLYKVGRQSLPQAFGVLADRLRAGNAAAILQRSNTRFLLESILRPYVYAIPHEVKADPNLRDAVIFLLDNLIDAGSSAAYRMREDFLTPIPPPQTATAAAPDPSAAPHGA